MNNLSKEEIIEIIEKLQCEYKEQQNERKYNNYTVFKAKEYSKGLQGLLDLYNIKCEQYRQLQAFYTKDYIRKDEIREKIKELENIEPSGEYNFEIKNDIDSKINILQELLEE